MEERFIQLGFELGEIARQEYAELEAAAAEYHQLLRTIRFKAEELRQSALFRAGCQE